MRREQALLKNVLQHALPKVAIERIYSVELVTRRWVDVVGRELARRSEPEALSEGVLTVRVTDVVWGQMIYRLQDRIVPKLNRAIGVTLVRRINFTKRSRLHGLPETAVEEVGERARLEPPAELSALAYGIEDHDLRDLVLQIDARYLKENYHRSRTYIDA